MYSIGLPYLPIIMSWLERFPRYSFSDIKALETKVDLAIHYIKVNNVPSQGSYLTKFKVIIPSIQHKEHVSMIIYFIFRYTVGNIFQIGMWPLATAYFNSEISLTLKKCKQCS